MAGEIVRRRFTVQIDHSTWNAPQRDVRSHEVELEIDIAEVVALLQRAACGSKGRVSRDCHGAVVLRCLDKRGK